MKVKAFTIGLEKGNEAFEELTSDPNIAIHHIHSIADERCNWSIVYYDTTDSLTGAENQRLAAHQFVAQQVAKDELYLALKNQRSRELWLLAERGICAAEARDIIELARDEMRGVREKKVTP